jgi:hypothetical protein
MTVSSRPVESLRWKRANVFSINVEEATHYATSAIDAAEVEIVYLTPKRWYARPLGRWVRLTSLEWVMATGDRCVKGGG